MTSKKAGTAATPATKPTAKRVAKPAAKPAAAPTNSVAEAIAALQGSGSEDGEEYVNDNGYTDREQEYIVKVGESFLGWLNDKQQKTLKAKYEKMTFACETYEDFAVRDAAFSDEMVKIFRM